MVANDPLIGRRLGGVRIDRVIGHGGMARVYYGWDDRLQRPVAIKVIGENYRNDPAFVDRFLREARTVASLRHPNILQVYYSGEEDGYSYFVMEFIQGMNLEQLLQRQRQSNHLLPVSEVLRIAKAAGSALDYAHSQGVIHRDVKPSNIILADDGRVVLADFGLALQSTTSTLGQVFGSPHYIAPEQARNSSMAVPESDLYSLGIVLYEMLTGMVPFHDPSPTALALQHMTEPPPLPSAINPSLSPQIDAVLLKALSKAPSDRYHSAGDLLAALEAALQGKAADTAPVTMPVLPYRPNQPAAQARPVSPIPATVPGGFSPREAYAQPASGVYAYPQPARRAPPPPPLIPRRSGLTRLITCATLLVLLLALLSAMAFAVQSSNLLSGIRLPSFSLPGFFPGPPAVGVPTINLRATETALAPRPTATPKPTATPNPTFTPPPSPTPLPPTATPQPTNTSAVPVVPPPSNYDLILNKNGAQSMFLVNNGSTDFPLSRLVITDGQTNLPGSAWNADPLKPGNCTAVWIKGNKPAFPKGLKCTLVGSNLKTGGDQGFWVNNLQVLFDGQLVGLCTSDQQICEISFAAGP